MFMKKKVLPEVEEVKLPVLFGLRPGKYILVLLIAAILLVLFLLGILPGIINGGRYVHFESPYTSVGVVVDGRYMGSSDGSLLFINSGLHEVEYIKSGRTVARSELKIDHPLFLTLLFKRTKKVDIDIPSNREIYDSALELSFRDLPLYSRVIDYNEFYNYRPIYSDLANDAVAAGVKDVSDELLVEAMFINSSVMYEDYMKAVEIYEKAGISYRSEGLSRVDQVLEKLVGETGDFVTYSGSVAEIVPEKTELGFRYPASSFSIGSDTIESWEGASIYPVKVSTEAFTLQDRYVSEYDWALFVEANPYWSKDNLENIVKDGMADEYYLAGIFPSVNVRTDKPVRNISYHAAKAYAEWMEETTGRKYRLPTEAELELAMDLSKEEYATSLRYSDYSEGPHSLNGGLWEMTSTSYLPLARVSGNYDLSDIEVGDYVVKGGSFVNAPTAINPYSVGSLDRTDCSEYLGFRLAIGE